MSSSRLSKFCDRALDAGWLLGVTITPVFFNVYSSRVFEPDKLTTLRALAGEPVNWQSKAGVHG